MSRLGPSLWDDPNYVLGTIEPRGDGVFDLGSPQNRFRNIYLTGDVVLDDIVGTSLAISGNASIGGDITLDGELILTTNNNAIRSETDDQSRFFLAGTDTTDGAYFVMRGVNAVSSQGAFSIVAGNHANGNVILNIANASARIRFGGTLGDMWDINNAGDLRQNATNGGSILISRSGYGMFGNSTDGADNLGVSVASGSSATSTRGAYLTVYGNEHANTGRAELFAGNIAGSVCRLGTTADTNLELYQNGVLKWRISTGGHLRNDATNGGSLIFENPTTFVQAQSGANGRTGTFTLNGATPVVVNNTSLSANDMIIIMRDTPAGTPGNYELTARTNGASFAVTGTALDTSGMRYILIRVN